MQPRNVAVIGAGASGICAAKYLLQAGQIVTIFEKGSHIGGLWVLNNDSGTSAAYRTLHINTPKSISHYHDFPFSAKVGPFPSHSDMREYLDDYTDHFGLRQFIRFRTEVTRAEPTPGGAWRLSFNHGEPQLFDAVVVATGHLSTPYEVPEYRDRFAGEYMHSFYYREPDPFAGKRVCVVGIGNSALDISSDICPAAKTTVLVARSGVVIKPLLIFGKPFTDFTLPLSKPWIPGFIREALINALVYLTHGRMIDLGFKPAEEKKVHSTASATAVQHIARGNIRVKHGIKTIAGQSITFDDGTTEVFDVLICATGYNFVLPFIDPAIIPIEDNRIRLYQRIVPPGRPGIYLIGMLTSNSALNHLFERQAQWIAEHITGTAVLPSDEEMWQVIAAKDQWVAETYKSSRRHRIQEEELIYFRELGTDLRRARRRALADRRGKSRTASQRAESEPTARS